MAFLFYYISFLFFYLLNRSINIFTNKKFYKISILLKIPGISKMPGIWQHLVTSRSFIKTRPIVNSLYPPLNFTQRPGFLLRSSYKNNEIHLKIELFDQQIFDFQIVWNVAIFYDSNPKI